MNTPKQTLWITGASGFTGGFLTDYVRSLPNAPRIVGVGIEAEGPRGADSYVQVDITDAKAVGAAAATHPPDLVIHGAGVMPPDPASRQWHVNVGGTATLLDVLDRGGVGRPKVVVIGSCAEYRAAPHDLDEDAPTGGESDYGRSKWAQSQVVMAAAARGVSVSLVRPFNLIGPGLPARWVAGSLARQFARRPVGTISIGNLHPERDFLDVRDAVRGYWRALVQGSPGRAYNVCSGRAVSIAALLACFQATRDEPIPVENQAQLRRSGDPDRVVGDPRRARDELGWMPEIDLADSVSDMVKGFQASGQGTR